MKNYLIVISISYILTSCYSKNDEKCDSLLLENNELLIQINYLSKKSDSLQLELEKCDNWVNLLESE